jgi:hypothetical protein
MAEIRSESVADFIPESMADFARNTQTDATRCRGDDYRHNLYVGKIVNLAIDSRYFHDAIVGREIL